MRKSFLTAALLAALILSGCGKTSAPAAVTPTAAPARTTAAVTTPEPTAAAEPTPTTAAPTPTPTPAPTPTPTPAPAAGGIRPEFKASMDEYEKFFDEYCEFMKKYKENPTDMQLLARYASLMAQYTETMNALDNMDTSEMSDEELLYYTQVTMRIESKLLAVMS